MSGRTLTARTGSFGYYKFEDLTAGEAYILAVVSNRFIFENATRVIAVSDEVKDADFISSE